MGGGGWPEGGQLSVHLGQEEAGSPYGAVCCMALTVGQRKATLYTFRTWGDYGGEKKGPSPLLNLAGWLKEDK